MKMAVLNKLNRNNLEILVHVTSSGPDTRWQDYAESILTFEPVTRQKLQIESNQSHQDLLSSSCQSILMRSHWSNKVGDVDICSSSQATTQSMKESHAGPYLIFGQYVPHTTYETCYENTRGSENSKDKSPFSERQVDSYSDMEIEFDSACLESHSHRLPAEEDLKMDCKPVIQKKVSQVIIDDLAFLTTDQNHCESEVSSKYTNDYHPDMRTGSSKNGRALSTIALNSKTLANSFKPGVNINERNHEHVSLSRMAEPSGTTICYNPYPNSSIESRCAEDREELRLLPIGPDKLPIVSSIICQDIVDQWTQTLEIRSPPPDIGNLMLTPEVLITPSLRVLAEQGKIEQNFQPENSLRELRPLERGYWSVICPSWKRELRIRFWNYLGNYIQEDNSAGWGVSCMRDENFEQIRVYCWGIIVGHIYLLLYATSEGEIFKTDACWIDAEGKTILKIARRVQPEVDSLSC